VKGRVQVSGLTAWFRRRFPSARRSSSGFVTITTVIAVVASAFVVLVGSSEKAGVLDLLNGHTWLRNTKTGTLSLANDATGLVDFNLKIDGTANANISVTEDGRLALLVDPKSRTYAAVDLARYGTRDGQKVDDVDALDLVLSGRTVFVIDRAAGVVEQRDGSALGKQLGRVKIGGELTRGVIGDDERLWVADERTGRAVAIVGGNGSLRVAETVPVADRGTDLELSVVDGRPTVLDFGANVLATIDGDQVGERVRLPLQVGESMRVPREVRDAPLPISVNTSGRVVLVDGGDATSVPLDGRKGTTLGEPAVFAGRIYVPDERTGEVVVLDGDGGVIGVPVKVRDTPGPIDLVPGVDVLYLQAPDGSRAVQVDEDGNRRTVDKTNPQIPTNDPQPPPAPPLPDLAPAPAAPGPPVAIAAAPPGGPVAPVATCGNRKVDLAWGPAPENGAPVTGYVVTWSASKGAGGTQTVGAQTTVQVTGLTNGTTYTMAVAAQSAAGLGPAVQANPCAPSSAIPDAPENVRAEAGTDGSITVSWDSADDGKGTPVPTYVVSPVVTPPAAKTVTAAPGLRQQVKFDGADLVRGTQYQFTVRSQLAAPPGGAGAGASSPASQPSSPVKSRSAPLVAPTGLSAAPGDKRITLTWTACSAPECTGGEAIKYLVSMNGGPPAEKTTPAEFPGLVAGTEYTFNVFARNSLGDGPGATVSATASAPPVIADFSVSTDGNRSARWNVVPTGYGRPTTCSVTITWIGGSQTSNSCNGQSQPIGWSTGFTVSATATNEFGTSAPRSGSSSTRAAVRRVQIGWGGSAQGQGDCGSLCSWITVTVRDFNPNEVLDIKCLTTRRADGSRQGLATWTQRSATANGDGWWSSDSGPSNCFFGYPNQAVQLWVNGVYSDPLECRSNGSTPC